MLFCDTKHRRLPEIIRTFEHGSRGDNLAEAGLDEEALMRAIRAWRPRRPAAAPGRAS